LPRQNYRLVGESRDPFGDASIAPIGGAGRPLRHERNRRV
jgi:hypothetical protein